MRRFALACLGFLISCPRFLVKSASSVHIQRERVIGIDPGSIRCGVAIIERDGMRLSRVYSETIECGRGDFPERLETVYERISSLCTTYAPDRAAIEGIFHFRNADSALKLGHARGVAMLALRHARLNIHEFQPAQIKKAVGSYGAAGKDQVRAMVMRLLSMESVPGLDESDALAIAITAAWTRELIVDQVDSPLRRSLAAQAPARGPSGFQQRVAEALARTERRGR